MLLSFHVQLLTHIIHFMAYKSVSLFLMRSTLSFEHLMVGARATMDSELEEQTSATEFLLLEGEKPCHIFQKVAVFFFF